MDTKFIGIYSGKGGVGKTTVTVLLALNLLKNGKKVYVLDMDLHTPSIHKMFKDFNGGDNFKYNSTGKSSSEMLYLPESLIKEYINNSISEIKNFKPDYVLIDFGPSIMESHVQFVSKISLSGIVLVTQPTELSFEDVKRTIAFFNTKSVPVLGIVYNDNTGVLRDGKNKLTEIQGYETLFIIPNDSDKFKDTNSLKQNDFLDQYNIINKFESLGDSFIKTAKINMLLGDDIEISEERIKEMFIPNNFNYQKYNKPYFINLKTWDLVRDIIIDYYEGKGLGPIDQHIIDATTENIKNVLDAFKNSTKALFRVKIPPCTGTFFMPLEIIECTLDTEAEFFYKIPMLNYHGTRFFIGEVVPVSAEEYQEFLDDGFIIKGDRLIPPIEVIEYAISAFGEDRLFLSSDWRTKYNTLLNS